MRGISLLCAAAAAMIAALPARANDTMDVLTNGAGLFVEYADGTSLTVRFAADGTFATDDGRSGTWTIDANELCQQVAPDGDGGCTILASGNTVGDSWEMLDIYGNAITVRIIE